MKLALKYWLVMAAIVAAIALFGALAQASDKIQSCVQADGTMIYTNKDIKGCTTLKAHELSVVPSYDQIKHEDIAQSLIVPTPPVVLTPEISSVLSDTCQLYHEWVKLNSTDQGGLRNNTIERQQRRVALTMIFGSGFSPSNCK
jgi:hypothetical protein